MTSTPTPHTPGLQDWISLLILTVLWGSAFAFIGHIVDYLPSAAMVFVRLSLAALMLTGWAMYRGRRLPGLRDKRWIWFAGLGFFGNTLPFILIGFGQQTIDSNLAGILVATMPLATLALAHVFVPGERMTARMLIGFLIGFAGVVLLMGPSALTAMGGADTLAQLAVVGAAVCYGINAVLARLIPDTPASVSGAGMLITASVLAAPLGVWDLVQTSDVPLSAWSSVVWLAIGPTAIASVLLMQIARTAGPGFLAVVNYLTPIAAVITGVIIGETIGWDALLALTVILAGVWIAKR